MYAIKKQLISLLLSLLLISPAYAARSFVSASSDRVDHGSNASIDNPAIGAIWMWIYPTSVSVGRRTALHKLNGVRISINDTNSGDLFFTIPRATTNLNIRSSTTAVLTVNEWQFIAFLFDTSGLNGNQRAMRGTLISRATEPSYANQTVGTGTKDDDAASNMLIGNHNNLVEGFPGRIGMIGIIAGRYPSFEEVQSLQFHPRVVANTVFFVQYGFNSVESDWSGNLNNGTVTGATISDHVPLTRLLGKYVSPYQEIISSSRISGM